MKIQFNPLAAGCMVLAAKAAFGSAKPKKLPKDATEILNQVLRQQAKDKSSIPGML